MGWSIGYDSATGRDIGYGVPAFCDHPKCHVVIDRGLSYVCGGDHHSSDLGCGLYFCHVHLSVGTKYQQVCNRCLRYRPPYKHLKPEHPRWIQHKLTDESWQQWRDTHPNEVAQLIAQAGEAQG